jgi:predicted nucleic acid-binding protein
LLLIDTNILVRCSLGRALTRVTELRDRGVKVATTENNVDELYNKLTNKFRFSAEHAEAELRRVLEPMEVVGVDEYEHLRGAADARLRDGGKSDWPALAAALALEGEIWSEDVDFFGIGVPVWSTANVHLVDGAMA